MYSFVHPFLLPVIFCSISYFILNVLFFLVSSDLLFPPRDYLHMFDLCPSICPILTCLIISDLLVFVRLLRVSRVPHFLPFLVNFLLSFLVGFNCAF